MFCSYVVGEANMKVKWHCQMFQLDNCSDYEGRRKIRARLRVVMAEQKGV